eukprot:896570-Rhodomonas_salina.1
MPLNSWYRTPHIRAVSTGETYSDTRGPYATSVLQRRQCWRVFGCVWAIRHVSTAAPYAIPVPDSA